MRTVTHTTPGPVHFSLDAGAAYVTVFVQDVSAASVTLEPTDPGDTIAADLIERTTVTSDGDRFDVRVPRPADNEGVSVVRDGYGSVNVVAGTVTGSVIGLDMSGGVTIVNGQVITGSGTTTLHGGGLRITVKLPRGSAIDVSGQSLTVTAVGELVQALVKTVSGDVHLNHVTGARVSTTSGDVRIGYIEHADLRTVSGDVVVRELAGRARVKTVSGDIRVYAVADSTVQAGAVSGDIDITAAGGVDVDTDTRSVSGRTRNHRER